MTLPDQIFKGHTTAVLSATAGVAIQLENVFGKIPVECGYQFFYLGDGQLSKKSNQVLSTLATGPTYANAVLCTVRI